MSKRLKLYIDDLPLRNLNAFRGVGKYTKQLRNALLSEKEIELIDDPKDKEKAEIIHYPYFDLFFHTLPIIKKKKTIVTIHDCIPLVFHSYYPSGLRGSLSLMMQKLSLLNTSLIVTDSLASKTDIYNYLKVPLNKIEVVYLGIDSVFRIIKDKKKTDNVRKKYCLPEKFILYVGDINYNKNLPNLLKAFINIEEKDIFLVLAGKAFESIDKKKFSFQFSIAIPESTNRKIINLGYVSDEELAILYNEALVYCQPSYYEGFGLQILEAMACGCPVITGNTSSMIEVAKDAGLLVDPYSVKEISDGIKKVVSDDKLRNNLVNKGLLNASNYSWQKTAQKMVQLYKKTAGF